MKGIIIAYRVRKHNTHAKTHDFCKKFYGYVDRSNKGKYRYERSGLLNEIPHVKIIRGVIIVKREDKGKILGFLKKYNAEIFVRDIELTVKDQKNLKIK